MAGHSKWANIKRRKGAQDAKRGKLFTKLIKEIMVAAKLGGGDLDMNPRLRLAVDKAKANSMPKDKIEGAIAKATGDFDAGEMEDLTYEGYAPGGVAILVQCLTDNKNRTVADVRHAFSKYGGNLGTSGSVAYLFTQKGVFTLPKEGLDEETVTMAALEGDAEDVEDGDDEWVVTSAFESYDTCKTALEELGVEVKSQLTMVPDNYVPVEPSDVDQVEALIDQLDDLDDVQDTYSNADWPDN